MSVVLKNDPNKAYFVVQGDEGRTIYNIGWMNNSKVLRLHQEATHSFKINREKIEEDRTITGFYKDGNFTQDENGDVTVNIKAAYKKFNMTSDEIISYAKDKFEIIKLIGTSGKIQVTSIEERDRDTRITLSWMVEREVVVIPKTYDALYNILLDSGLDILVGSIVLDGYSCGILRNRYE